MQELKNKLQENQVVMELARASGYPHAYLEFPKQEDTLALVLELKKAGYLHKWMVVHVDHRQKLVDDKLEEHTILTIGFDHFSNDASLAGYRCSIVLLAAALVEELSKPVVLYLENETICFGFAIPQDSLIQQVEECLSKLTK